MQNSQKSWRRTALVVLLLGGVLACSPASGVDSAVDDYNFAAWLYNNGKYEVAVGSYEAFLKNYATHEKVPDARFGLAQSLFHLNRFDEAMGVYEALRRDKPDFPQMAEVLFQLGQTCVAKKDFSKAGDLFAEVRTAYPEHYLADWALARQGACLLSLDRYADAEILLAEFVSRYAPDNRPPEKSDAVRQAFKRMSEEGGVSAESAFLGLIERSVFYLGIAQFNAGTFDEARTMFERFLALYAKSDLDTEARFRLAQCLYRTDRFDDAASAFAPVAEGDSPFAATAAYERGLALYKSRKLKDASTALTKMATRFPGDVNATRAALHAGTFLYEAGDYAGAAERLRDQTARGLPFADEAAYWLGMSLLKNGKSAEAEVIFTQALKDYSKSPFAGDMRLGLADAYLAQENMEGAAEAFTDYADRFSKTDAAPQALYSACIALHRSEMYEKSDARCSDFLKRFKDQPQAAQVLFLSGENRFLRKQYDAAAERYREFMGREKEAPDQLARAHFRLAWCHRHSGRFAEALAELDKADLKSAGKAIADEALYVRGACQFDLAQYADAAKTLSAYVKADERGRFADDAILKMSVAQARTGDKAGAVAGFERFLKLYPKSELAVQTRYQMAEGLFELKRFDKAAKSYAEVLESTDAVALQPFALLGLGQCAYEQGAWKEAATRFGELSEKYATSDLLPQALYRQGQALTKDGRAEEAEAAFLALTSRYAKHELARSAWMAIGTSRQKRGAWEEAAQAFKQATLCGGPTEDQPRLLYELAWSYREAGLEADSLQAFRELAKAFPADPLAADANFHLAEAKYKEAGASGDKPDEAALRAFQEAAALYQTVLDLTQDVRLADKAWYRLGWCRWSRGEFTGAAEAFDMLVERYANSDLAPDALFQAGQALAQAGNMEEAITRYEKLINTRSYAGFQHISETYVALGEAFISTEKEEAALVPLRKAIDTGGDGMSATRAYFLSGKTLYQRSRYKEASECFEAVTKRSRGALAAEAQFYIGQIEQAQERYEQAIIAYLRVQAIYDAYPEWVGASLLETGKCQEALGRPDEAQKAFQQVVKDFSNTKWSSLARERLN